MRPWAAPLHETPRMTTATPSGRTPESSRVPWAAAARVLVPIATLPLLIGWAFYAWVPGARAGVLEEDHFVEWLSALTFLAAGLVGAWCLLRGRSPGERLAVAVAALLGLLGFADELSFGERLFALDMPRIRGLKIDGAHDFAEVVAKGARDLFRAAPVLVGLGAAAVAGAGLMIAWRFKYPLLGLAREATATTPRLALLAAAAAVGLATLIDLPLAVFDHDFVKATEELIELAAAALLLAVPILAASRRPPR